MDDVFKARIRDEVGALTSDSRFREMVDRGGDERFEAFRHGVELLEKRTLARPPADASLDELRDRLAALRELCEGPLASFGTYLDAGMAHLEAGSGR
ncbi:MAG TPA: hypothetical protein VMY76_11755 [Gemmatimonadales bacterium]|nr:hypothetical protein [Gemmatimonadales bacterium]